MLAPPLEHNPPACERERAPHALHTRVLLKSIKLPLFLEGVYMLMRPACGARAAAAGRLAGCLQRKASADAATRGAVGAGAARPQSVFGGGSESTSRRSLSHRQVHPAHLRPQEAPPVARPRRPSVQFSFRRQTRRFRPSSAVFFFVVPSWAPFSVRLLARTVSDDMRPAGCVGPVRWSASR